MLKSSTFSFSIFKLTTVAIIFYCANTISQVQGDSVHIESTYAKKFTGRISKVDKEGYFIKTSYNREIFLSKLEIKTIKVVLEWVEPDVDTKASTSIIDSNDINTDNTNILEEKSEIEISEKIESTSELSEFYMKYNLGNFDISSFNFLSSAILSSSIFILFTKSSPSPKILFKIKNDKMMIKVITINPPNCLTCSGNSFNLLK